MNAKEYARAMREELYRQNKSVLEVTDDLWLAIADNMEKFAQQAVEEYKNKIVEQLEEYAHSSICRTHKGICPYRNNDDMCCENCGAVGALEIVKSGGAADD